MDLRSISPSHLLKGTVKFTVWLTPLILANSTPYLNFYSKRGGVYDIIEVVGKGSKNPLYCSCGSISVRSIYNLSYNLV